MTHKKHYDEVSHGHTISVHKGHMGFSSACMNIGSEGLLIDIDNDNFKGHDLE